MPAPFHEVRFPLATALKASGGPERRTDIVTTATGREERNQRWYESRRKYDVGSAVKSYAALTELLAFFEERRGRLYGFRFRDRLDWQSGPPGAGVTPADQVLGAGDGQTAAFQLAKTYGTTFAPYVRRIAKPVTGSVRVAVAGVEKTVGTHCDVDATTGIVTFRPGNIPANGAAVTAGFAFDVPVRFDTDFLDIDLEAFTAGAVPHIPLVEIIL